jgi:2-keto-4-pentenoate hydratase/2-oxohepta-3-ene-1,7-dioic acid hydratase in catechol pathway
MAGMRTKTCSGTPRQRRYGSMRFAHLTARERPLAVVEGDRVAALAMEGIATVDDLLAAGPDAWDAARDAAPAALEDGGEPLQPGMLDAPLKAPSKIACVGLNYHDHCRETGMAAPERPLIFAKFPSSLVGPDAAIESPDGLTEQVDWEVELAVVIGRRIRHASERAALDAIFGYTAANDVSARDLQFADQQWVRAKSIDTFCPVGPVIVTPDEFGDPQQKRLVARVNGETMQDSTTAEMIFGVAEIVSFLSQACTLEPGDLILTGTPWGVGGFRDPPVFLKPGDTIEIEVEGVGVLANDVRRNST